MTKDNENTPKTNRQKWIELMQQLGIEISSEELIIIADALKDVGAYEDLDRGLCIKVIRSNQNDVDICRIAIISLEGKEALVNLDTKITKVGFDTHEEELKEFAILLPLEEREINSCGDYVNTYNLKTQKHGLFSLSSKDFMFPEEFDSITQKAYGWLLEANGKFSFKGYINTYDIPEAYDGLQDANIPSYAHVNNHIVFTNEGGLLGAYCYTNDCKPFYDVTLDRTTNTPYVKSKCVSPLFEGLELARIDEEKKTIILETTLNGKIGLLDVFNERFIVPIIFDEITSFIYNPDGTVICYGVIGGVQSLYDGNGLYELVPMSITYGEEYNKARELIEKKK